VDYGITEITRLPDYARLQITVQITVTLWITVDYGDTLLNPQIGDYGDANYGDRITRITVTVYSIPNSARSIRKIDNFLPSLAEAWYCFSERREAPRALPLCLWYSLLAELFSGWRERSGERKAGALFEIGNPQLKRERRRRSGFSCFHWP
jgi:hypothetical protein